MKIDSNLHEGVEDKMLKESRPGTKILGMSWSRYRDVAMRRGKNVKSIIVSCLFPFIMTLIAEPHGA